MTDVVRGLAGIVGPESVSHDATTLTDYSGDRSFAPPISPAAVVRPGSAEEVTRLVAWANETATPLVPVSSGPPRHHGDTVPSVPGCVVVDLGRMDTIRRIDRRNRMAVIEPGVTYAQLQPDLAKEGLRLATPLLARMNKSVVASLLERQPTLTPRYNYTLLEPLRDLGVVWGSGAATYTGEAGYGPASLEHQWEAGARQVDPKGPAQTDFFRLLSGAQGTLGIVTWASVKLELLPAARDVCFVTASRLDDLLDLAHHLLRVRLGDELFIANATLMASLLAAAEAGLPTPAAAESPSGPTALAHRVAALRDALPVWTLVVALGGRAQLAEERLSVQFDDLHDFARAHGHEVHTTLPGTDAATIDAALRGLDATGGWRSAPAGASQEIFFLTTLDKAPGYVATMTDVALDHGYPLADLGIYLQPQHQGVACHCEFVLAYDPWSAAPVARVRTVHQASKRQTDRRRRLLLTPVRRLGRAGVRARPHFHPFAPRGEAHLRPQQHPEPGQALLCGRRRPGRAPGSRGRPGGGVVTLLDYRADAMRCTRCSYCKWIPFDLVKSARFAKGCPSVDFNSFHNYSGGGRLITYLSLLDGRSEITERVVDIAFKCQLCGNCDVTCKVCRYDMEVLEALHEFRVWLVEQGRVPERYPRIIEHYRREHSMVGRPDDERHRWAEGIVAKDLTTEKAEVVFHPGCRYSFDGDLADVARTSVDLLRRAGVDFGILGAGTCCGGQAYHMGYRDDFAAAATRTVEAWAAAGVTTVVTPCADCYHTFKRLYPTVGSTVEVVHMVEFVDRLLKSDQLAFTTSVPLTVTYHDPCHLGRQGEPYVPWSGAEKKIYGQAVVYDPPRPRSIGAYGIYEPPRDVLRAIPGLELVEMERTREAAWCCGAGGGVGSAYPEFNAWTAAERVEEARCTGADALVTACPWCERNFIDAVARGAAGGGASRHDRRAIPGAASGPPYAAGHLQVFDVMHLVRRALGGEVAR